ncbi:MAG: hypothetical protein WC375_04325 [Methanomassiliicoccales archaeon]|jgi:hypothetical protein
MPVPIKGKYAGQSESPFALDYSILLNQITEKSPTSRMVTASNEDASLIMDLWMTGERIDDKTIKTKISLSGRDIARLKSNGFITTVTADTIKLTNKGAGVITTMVLSEPNRFAKNKKKKNYNEILASMSKKNKNGYRMPRYAASSSNNLRLS